MAAEETKNMMAFPELRHPFEVSPIHAAGEATVLYQGRRVTVKEGGDGDALLIEPEMLEQINGFSVKPEGACYEDLCIPLNDRLLVEEDGRQWLDLTAFAEMIEQPYVADTDARVWSFAEIPAKREHRLLNALVPDIEVTDRQGNVIRLADLKGKKALIVTWSSW